MRQYTTALLTVFQNCFIIGRYQARTEQVDRADGIQRIVDQWPAGERRQRNIRQVRIGVLDRQYCSDPRLDRATHTRGDSALYGSPTREHQVSISRHGVTVFPIVEKRRFNISNAESVKRLHPELVTVLRIEFRVVTTNGLEYALSYHRA